MKELNFDPIILTQSLVRCESITPEDNGAIECIKLHLENLIIYIIRYHN